MRHRAYVPSSAFSSLEGFRTPAAECAVPSLKRPASETLHKPGNTRSEQIFSALQPIADFELRICAYHVSIPSQLKRVAASQSARWPRSDGDLLQRIGLRRHRRRPLRSRTASDRKESHCETGMRSNGLHLPRDFSQEAISGDTSGNSTDMSNSYFYKPIGSSNPLWSAT